MECEEEDMVISCDSAMEVAAEDCNKESAPSVSKSISKLRRPKYKYEEVVRYLSRRSSRSRERYLRKIKTIFECNCNYGPLLTCSSSLRLPGSTNGISKSEHERGFRQSCGRSSGEGMNDIYAQMITEASSRAMKRKCRSKSPARKKICSDRTPTPARKEKCRKRNQNKLSNSGPRDRSTHSIRSACSLSTRRARCKRSRRHRRRRSKNQCCCGTAKKKRRRSKCRKRRRRRRSRCKKKDCVIL